jgi:GH3 auxin-responsive promoter
MPRALAWARIAAAAAAERTSLECALADGAQQPAFLARLLRANASTAFGEQHGFAGIRDVRDYLRQVPLRGDAEYRPWLARVAEGQARVLTEAPVVAFESTGGTSGAKLIPYTEASLEAFRAGVLPWLSSLLQRFPRIAEGLAYVAASPVTRAPRQLPCGLPLGLPSDAAYLGADLLPALSQVITVPPAAGEITRWRVGTLAHLARRPELTFMSVWSPTFLLELLEALPRNAESVLVELHGNPEATRRLERALTRTGGLTTELWPDLQCVSLWMDGASAPYAARVAALLPGVHLDAKGVLATESVITVNTARGPVPAVTSAFLEFIDAAGASHLAHELEPGQRYRVALTTPGGLYRYDIGDEFDCTAAADGEPQLHFAGRAGVISDLVGEKLTDSFVAQALSPLSAGASLVPSAAPHPHYELWVDSERVDEDLASRIDARLNDNPQYAYARQLGQLRALEIVCAPGFAQYRARLLASQGGRLGDAKSCALILDRSQLPVPA